MPQSPCLILKVPLSPQVSFQELTASQ